MVVHQQKYASFLSRCTFTLSLLLWPTSAYASDTQSCLDRLLNALEKEADLSTCGLLSTTDGRIAATSADGALFVQMLGNGHTIYIRLDSDRNSVEVERLQQQPWTAPISGRQTFPDAKSFYFPFLLSNRNNKLKEEPREIQIHCIPAQSFSAARRDACP